MEVNEKDGSAVIPKGKGVYLQKLSSNGKWVFSGGLKVCMGCQKIPSSVIYKAKIYSLNIEDNEFDYEYYCPNCAKKLFPNYFKKGE